MDDRIIYNKILKISIASSLVRINHDFTTHDHLMHSTGYRGNIDRFLLVFSFSFCRSSWVGGNFPHIKFFVPETLQLARAAQFTFNQSFIENIWKPVKYGKYIGNYICHYWLSPSAFVILFVNGEELQEVLKNFMHHLLFTVKNLALLKLSRVCWRRIIAVDPFSWIHMDHKNDISIYIYLKPLVHL